MDATSYRSIDSPPPGSSTVHDGPDGPGGDSLPLTIAEGFASGDHVRLFGRWANVQLTPDTNDRRSARMFVIERHVALRRAQQE